VTKFVEENPAGKRSLTAFTLCLIRQLMAKRKVTANDTTATMPDAKKPKKATKTSTASGGANDLKGEFLLRSFP
jgi:hypothetical protein